ncbi:MAG: hypothetical protein ACOVQJ_00205 [Bacteroidia bacterium]
MRISVYILAPVLLFSSLAKAQTPWVEPNSWADLMLQMNETNAFYSAKHQGPSWFNYTNRYFLRGQIDSIFQRQQEADTMMQILRYIPTAAEFNGKWLLTDNAEFLSPSRRYIAESKKPILKGLYAYKSLFYNYREGNSSISLNPILNLQAGPSSQWGHTAIQNTRGAEIRGTFGNKVGFYTRVLENQWFAPAYTREWGDSLGAAPGVGWWRYTDSTGFDYFSVKGYISTSVVKNHINAAFGHDRIFIGNGYRSLILSDFAKEYLFLRLNTRIGPFHYQNIFAQLHNRVPSPGTLPGNTLLPKKYMAVHRASVKIRNWLEIGATEMIVFDRDSMGDGGFEAQYLNPVIFYRAVESNQGSRDNAMVALDAKAYVLKKGILYGQLLIDEFRVSEIRAGNNWWANKFGLQTGAKTTLNIKHGLLFLQVERNVVKPYTYSHYRSSQDWSNYGQPLAHPLGANFREVFFRAVYQPGRYARWRLAVMYMRASKGMDSSYYGGPNYGGMIYKSNDSRIGDYNIVQLQGNKAEISHLRFEANYMLRHNLYLELAYQKRSQTGFRPTDGNWLQVGLRLNTEALNTLY